MAQYFWSAEDYNLGDNASDAWSGSYPREIKEDAAGRKYLEVIVTDEDTFGATLNQPLANDAQFQIRAIVSNNEELSRHTAFGLAGSTDVATIDTLAADQHNNPTFRLRRFDNGSVDTLATVSNIPGFTRMEVTLTYDSGSFTFTADEVDGPESATVTGTKSLDLAFGLFSTRGGDDPFRIYEVGIGTAEDDAPDSPVLPPGGVSYGEGFYETVVSGVAAVDEVEVALMSGTTVVETLTTTTSPTASSGSINWLPSQLTFQSVDGTFNNVRVRVRVDGAGTFADVGTWATGNQSPGGNNVTVSNITTTNNSEPAFGVLAGGDTSSESVRFRLLDGGDSVLIESVETVNILPAPAHLVVSSADIQNTTGDTITITGLSLRLDTGTGEVDFATGMTLVDDDTFSTPLSAELQNNQVLSLTETRITYTEED